MASAAHRLVMDRAQTSKRAAMLLLRRPFSLSLTLSLMGSSVVFAARLDHP